MLASPWGQAVLWGKLLQEITVILIVALTVTSLLLVVTLLPEAF